MKETIFFHQTKKAKTVPIRTTLFKWEGVKSVKTFEYDKNMMIIILLLLL